MAFGTAKQALTETEGKRPAFSWFLALGAVLVAVICGVFGLASLFCSELGIQTEAETLYTVLPSSPLFKWVIASIVVGGAILCGCQALAKHQDAFDEKLFGRVLGGLAFAFCIWWIFENGTETNGFSDSKQLLAYAQQLAAGDYSSFLPHSESFAGKLAGDTYLSNYPFQSGILLLLEGFVRVFGSLAVPAFQTTNAIAVVATAFSLVRMCALLERPKGERLITAALAFTFLPALVFVVFPYGNAIGFCLAMLAVELWMRSRGKGRKEQVAKLALAFLVLTLGLMVKSTYVVVVIGALIVLLIDCLRRRTPARAVALVASLLLANSVAGTLPAKVMEARLGYEFPENQPKLAWIAIGLSNDNVFGGNMPGWWGNSALLSQIENEGDVGGQTKDAVESISDTLASFANDPAYAVWFFAKKLSTEWLDPSFQSFYIADIGTMTEDAAPGETNSEDRSYDPWDVSFGHGYLSRALFVYMDGFESVVLLGAAIGGVALFRKARKTDNDPLDYLLPCVFFMGFFVYILWEAKGMYCMPFFFCLIPLAARGLATACERKGKKNKTELNA